MDIVLFSSCCIGGCMVKWFSALAGAGWGLMPVREREYIPKRR